MPFSLIADKSGSMGGPRIDTLKRVANMMVDMKCLFTLSTFNEELQYSDEFATKDSIQRLTSTGGTKIEKCFINYINLLLKKNQILTVMFITDCEDNVTPDRMKESFAQFKKASEMNKILFLLINNNENETSRTLGSIFGSDSFFRLSDDILSNGFEKDFMDWLSNFLPYINRPESFIQENYPVPRSKEIEQDLRKEKAIIQKAIQQADTSCREIKNNFDEADRKLKEDRYDEAEIDANKIKNHIDQLNNSIEKIQTSEMNLDSLMKEYEKGVDNIKKINLRIDQQMKKLGISESNGLLAIAAGIDIRKRISSNFNISSFFESQDLLQIEKVKSYLKNQFRDLLKSIGILSSDDRTKVDQLKQLVVSFQNEYDSLVKKIEILKDLNF